MRPMVEAGGYISLCCAVGAQFIGDDPFGYKSIALHQRHQQAFCRPFVASLLQDFFKNGAMLIYRTPKPEFLSRTFHDDLVQIPNIAGAGLPSSQIAGDLGPEFGGPAADRLIGNVDTTLKKHFLNFTQAQIESQIQPNCMGNDLRRKTVTLEADFGCLHRRNLRPTRNAGNCNPVYVTTPVEVMFGHLEEGGFTDEEAIRIMTVLSTLCLGHARDLDQAHKEAARTRSQLLKSALGAQTDRSFPNLERIAARNVDTYSAEQLAFSIDLLIAGAEEKLRSAGRR